MKKIFVLGLALLSAAASLKAQETVTSDKDRAPAPDRAAAKFGATITPKDAKAHLSVLASDEYEGRNTGEKGGHMAAEYIAAYFKKLGLEGPVDGSYYQQVALVKQHINDKTFTVNGDSLQFLEDFLFFPDLQKLELDASGLIFAGYGIEDEKYNDYQDVDVNGKVVMILPGEPFGPDSTSYVTGSREFSEWTANQEKKLELLKEKGASAIIMVTKSVATYAKNYRNYFAGSSMKLASDLKNQEEKPALLYVSPEAAGRLLAPASLSLQDLQRKIASTGKAASAPVKVSLRFRINRRSAPVDAANVLGYLEGSDPELKKELIVLTAHYDHEGIIDGKIYNGADDDGSGTTAVLEMAEAFAKAAKAGKGPRRSLLFMTVTGEEKGLLGSRYYSDHPVFPLENTITNLNIDMIGRVDSVHAGKPEYVYIIGSDKLSTQLHAINEKANATYTKLELDYTYNDPDDPNRFYYRSDHYNFAKHGIPIIFYFNGVHEDYHKHTDDIEKINFDALSQRTRLVFHTAWELANRDQRPEVDVENAFPSDR
ncbi:peptidase M28-like protein [Anseongella ginsenosidimutans]|uniref:Peptidase M28-like protein n=1 Tax=Anseongella ginsenosidimutans TaxID=496056 RepID=A0A4R3KQT9_9SPHI|nr:M28 family peptidase [Anseongella ginsenosidimutans]QEC52172.1 M28 family peptidase [Anseongella ginsenosidimutans]TCS86713.1 peptidase M28-like protein [Anseongella ginsenosidimutans]